MNTPVDNLDKFTWDLRQLCSCVLNLMLRLLLLNYVRFVSAILAQYSIKLSEMSQGQKNLVMKLHLLDSKNVLSYTVFS